MLSILPSTALKASWAVPPTLYHDYQPAFEFRATARRYYQERRGGETPSDLPHLYNIVLTGPLAVLCCILY